MTDSGRRSFDLADTYVHLTDGPAARPLEVGQDFWAKIATDKELQEGRLLTLLPMSNDWSHWEMHPAGDEVVVLLSGAVDLILEEEGGERRVELRGREAYVIPQGRWHRAVVHRPGDALFVTRGAGTQHRAID